MTSDVQFSQNHHLGMILLSRPQALNALSLEMIQSIHQQLVLWQTDRLIQAVVIQGAGDKAFCAGGDVRWLYDTGRHHVQEAMQFFSHEYELNQLIAAYPKPYIALLDGMTMGGGVGVSLHGSHPIASERFKFAMPETTIGFFPDVGASHLLSRCPGAIGEYLGLTGNRLGADDAYFCHLVKAIVPSHCFKDLVLALSQLDLQHSPFKQVDQCIH
jgi:enoyl-CoA hydratase/carnithine racemase